ncbi:hypothetical protein [Labilithrix luteola]|uniref:hypothetical protein n=1 Tax=Labilithrix luteola TaxID=1391654 RepID=UPI0011BA4FD7|nr:hypothetical protein [Labilithrix luteola]
MSRSATEQKSELRWEWQVPGGPRVAATLDVEAAVESVFVGAQRVGRGQRGARPEGHVVPYAGELPVVVTFDANVPVCILRVDGMEISPAVWPVPTRGRVRPPPRKPFSLGLVVVGLVAIAAIAAITRVCSVFDVRGFGFTRGEAGKTTWRAPNGLFVARFPSAFAARLADGPPGSTTAVLQIRGGDDAIVLFAIPLEPGSREPWWVHKRFYPEVLAALPRATGDYEELSRNDDTSAGDSRAVVHGRLKNGKGESAKVWSTAFVHGNAGYVFAYETREGGRDDDESALRRIVDATELSALAETSPR